MSFGLDWLSTNQSALVVGFCGVAANLCWPLARRRAHLLAGQVLACALMLAHFVLLGVHTAAAVMAVAGVQAALAIPLGRRPAFRHIYLASLALTPAVIACTWQGIVSMFSAGALVIVCIANYQLAQIWQRSLLIVAILFWIVHNTLAGSLPALVSNGLTLIVSTHMLVRTARLERVVEADGGKAY